MHNQTVTVSKVIDKFIKEKKKGYAKLKILQIQSKKSYSFLSHRCRSINSAYR